MKHNGTHLSMSGESIFSRNTLVNDISKDGEGMVVEEILHQTFEQALISLYKASASLEMHSFVKELHIPISQKRAHKK